MQLAYFSRKAIFVMLFMQVVYLWLFALQNTSTLIRHVRLHQRLPRFIAVVTCIDNTQVRCVDVYKYNHPFLKKHWFKLDRRNKIR